MPLLRRSVWVCVDATCQAWRSRLQVKGKFAQQMQSLCKESRHGVKYFSAELMARGSADYALRAFSPFDDPRF